MLEYQITVNGLRGSALLPFKADLAKLAADNCRLTDFDRTKMILRAPEQQREQAAAEISYDVEEAPFYVHGARLLLRDVTWGVRRPEVEDVKALSAKHPAETFYFIVVREGVGEIESLENFWRGKLVNGEVVARYAAEPIVWHEQAY